MRPETEIGPNGGALIALALALAAGVSLLVPAQQSPAGKSASVDVSTDHFRVLPADRAFDGFIAEASALHGVDPELVRAVIRAESRFDPRAVSHRGAQGLMQLMPVLSRELGVADPFDPRQNIFGGVRYLGRLLDRHRGDVSLALASYNAGPASVARFKGMPPFKETQGYVRKVRRLLAPRAPSRPARRAREDRARAD